MDTIKKITELIEDGTIEPPTRPYRKPCEANFINAAYDEPAPGEQTIHPINPPAGSGEKGKL